MKFKSIASPEPSKGFRTTGKKEVVPNQAMSLQEILQRFTRNEPLPIGKEVTYHESEDDLEKLATSDLVDRAEFIDKLKSVQKDYDRQERVQKEKAQKLTIEKAKEEVRKELEQQKAQPKDEPKKKAE